MHLLLIAPEAIPVPPPRGGSVEICIWAIARQLAVHHQVTVISRKAAGYPNNTVLGNLKIIRVAAGSQRKYLQSVMRYAKGRHYDWIQIDNRPKFIPAVKAAFRATPVSIFLHSLTFISQPVISQKTAAFCLSKADLVVANSASVANKVKQRYPGVSHKTRHVHLGVDMVLFRPPTPLERAKWRRVYGVEGSFTVAYAGRLIPRKGIPLLIKAMRQVRMNVPNARLLIAGGNASGSYGSYLRKTAAVHKVPAKFIGTLPHRRVRQAYWAADCFVCPSQKHEAFGLVNVEAMACGLPPVASRNGGIPEIIRHKRNGLLVDGYRRPASFASAILAVARSRSFGRKLGLQARKDMKLKFSWSRTAQQLIALYRGRG